MIQSRKNALYACKNGGGAATTSFPRTLYKMLEDASENDNGFDDIVSWQSNGKSFKVLQPQRFESEILRIYFRHTKYKSFRRQINVYGFRRIQTGPNKGGYSHKHFVRQSPELCDRIMRRPANQSIDSSTVSKRDLFGSSSSDDMNLQREVEPISLDDDLSSSFYGVGSGDLRLHGSEIITFYNFFYPEDPAEKALLFSSILDRGSDDDTKTIEEGGSSHYSSSRTKESDPLVAQACVSTSGIKKDDDEISAPLENKSFPWKVHQILEEAEREKFQHIVSWVKDGPAFKVHNSEAFLTKVMPNYFDQTKYESFRRQLNLYGFTRVNRGAERGEISHPSFIKGARLLCETIKKPKS